MASKLIILAAGSAVATDVALKGGMSLVDGSLVTAVFTGMAAVIGSISTLMWCRHRAGKRQRPLDTDDTYVTHGECKAHRCALEKRIDELGPALNRIFRKLNENDQRSEDRSLQLHRRLDPVIEKVAANSASVEMLKGLARDSSAGGQR